MNEVSTHQNSQKIKNNLEKIEVKKFYFSGGYFVHKIVKLLPTALLPTTTVIFLYICHKLDLVKRKRKGQIFCLCHVFLSEEHGNCIFKKCFKNTQYFLKRWGPRNNT